jgi:HK97 family phage portal protein
MTWLNPLRWFTARSTLRQPAGWLLEALGCERSLSGANVTPDAALSASVVWACTRVIAEAVATLPRIPYEPLAPKGKNPLPAHPLHRLLNREPNPEMTAASYFAAAAAHAILWGNSYSEVERTRAGDVVALWPLRPDMVTPCRSKGGALRYEVRSADHPEREPVVLRPENVLHVPGLSFDGIVGYSVVRKAREAIGLTLSSERFGAAWFGNGSRPGGFIKHPARLTPDAQANLRKSFEAIHGGVENAHRLAILEEGMEFQAMSVPPEDAQFLETRQFQVLEICRWFRVPPHKVADLTRATFSNIEHQGLEFVTDTLTPWLVRFEQEIDRKLFTDAEKARGLFCEHKVDALLRGDIHSRYQAYAIGRQWGWLSADDVRDAENLNPLPGEQGDAYLSPMNMVPAELLDDVVKAQIAGATKPAAERNPNAPAPAARKVADSHAPLIADVLRRATRVEIDKATRAAKKPDTYAAWRDEFYAGHVNHLRDMLRPPLAALASALEAAGGQHAPGPQIDARAWAWANGCRAASDRHMSDPANLDAAAMDAECDRLARGAVENLVTDAEPTP